MNLETNDNAATGGEATRSRRQQVIVVLALAGGLSLLLLIVALLFWPDGRALRPFRPAPTSVDFIIDGQPLLVTFTELSDNAAQYHNQRIRVTGEYLPLTPPTCDLYNGPVLYWALVSEGLQLNAKGFEAPLALLAPGSTMTVEGIWRLYTGPVGCGKGPETDNVWYLQVERIIQPNPLVSGTQDPRAYLLNGVSTPPFPTIGPSRTRVAVGSTAPPAATSATPTATGTAVTPVGSVVPTLTGTPDGTATATPTRFIRSTPTGTPPPTSSTPGTPTPAGTPGPTATSGPAPTSPPNPYPGGGNPTPMPTNTPPPY